MEWQRGDEKTKLRKNLQFISLLISRKFQVVYKKQKLIFADKNLIIITF